MNAVKRKGPPRPIAVGLRVRNRVAIAVKVIAIYELQMLMTLST